MGRTFPKRIYSTRGGSLELCNITGPGRGQKHALKHAFFVFAGVATGVIQP